MRRTDHRRGTAPLVRTVLAAAVLGALAAQVQAQAPGVPRSGAGGATGGSGAPGAGGATPIGTGGDPSQRPLTTQFGVAARIEYSDNIDLQPLGQELDGMLYELAPYVELQLNSPRGVGALRYMLRGQIRTGGVDPRDEVRHDLRSWADVKLTEDLAHVYLGAFVYDVNASPFGATSIDPGASTTNRTQYRDFEVAPYLFGRFDGDGRWTVRYSLRYVDPGDDFISNTINTVSALARTDLTQRRLGAGVRAQYYHVSPEGFRNYDGSEFDLLALWRVDPTFWVGAGIGYAANDVVVNDEGETSGWGPSFALEWLPDARSAVRARWAQRYYGNNGAIQATFRQSNWTFALDGSSGLSQGGVFDTSGYGALSPFAARPGAWGAAPSVADPAADTLAQQDALSPTPLPPGVGLLQSPVTYYQALVASVGYVGIRNSVVGSAFVSNRRSAVDAPGLPQEDYDQFGGSVTLIHRMNATNALRASAYTSRTDNALSGDRADLLSGLLAWDHRLGPRSVASLAGRLQRQRGTGATVEYDEAAVFATIDYRF